MLIKNHTFRLSVGQFKSFIKCFHITFSIQSTGAGLAFIIYPEVVSRLPISPLWAVLFFMMLITLGMGTQFSVVCTVHTTLLDVFPTFLRKGRRPTFVMMTLCCIGFCMGLICCTRVSTLFRKFKHQFSCFEILGALKRHTYLVKQAGLFVGLLSCV